MATREFMFHLGHDAQNLSDLRIVLLGYGYGGKSSSGNTILGREEFDTVGRTAQCVKRQGEVAGRQVTVVEAPGWWRNYQLKDTPELTREQIELSVSLCPPGPHALLLVIPLDIPFTETERRSVQEHLELLSERVWSHTIVLFTCGDWLGDTPIEQHIESEGESLHWLVEECGNRYHVLNNQKRDDHMQVTQLMEKIEEMVAGSREQHYKMEKQRIEELEEKRRRKEERVKERMMKVKRHRESLRTLLGLRRARSKDQLIEFRGNRLLPPAVTGWRSEPVSLCAGIHDQDHIWKRWSMAEPLICEAPHLSKLRILLLGYRYAGKSSSRNTILYGEEFDTVGRTAQCVKRQGEVARRQVTVVEAPGWWFNHQLEDTPELTKEQIELSVSLCPPGPHALLLVIPVDEQFTETEEKISAGTPGASQ
ncbi:hypothetical protein AALO_G00035990 [Alosa alosa]|uniref:AIG1-type G domain-containing protein n=1 Tax=Alosa alosa TaxID=278164 RepID=A0AAV6H6G5_9TELE|nr:hypothetical protein AALO_G00035990 [Alosa alosa]